MKSSIDKNIEKRKEFLQIRQHYIDTAHRSSNIFDRTMITLSTWALWVSMFFTEKNIDVTQKRSLLVSRILLWLAILLTLVSFYISEEANWKSTEKHDAEYKGNQEDAIKLWCKIECHNWRLVRFKWIWIACLILWISFLAVFLFCNIK